MFDSRLYVRRRAALRKRLGSGLALFLGNDDSPMNYTANAYAFRQDSSFLYYFGLDSPGLAAVVDADAGTDTVFGDDIDLEDIIWMGFQPSLKERAAGAGVRRTAPLKDLKSALGEALEKGRLVHHLPPYRPEHALKLADLLGIPAGEAKARASAVLIKGIVAQRSIKSDEEVAEIETALTTTAKMFETAMRLARPGVYERDIAGRIEGLAITGAGLAAFPIILTKNGQILHNHDHGNKLRRGDLIVCDAGADSPLRYAADITRTIPVGGRFSQRQRDVYDIVLSAQETAIRMMTPGLPYKDVHIEAAKVIAEGLRELGLIKGRPEDAVERGAHALFFPHGLGHMLGLDVHDMENLGEAHVGYEEGVERSGQFGLAYLRMAKELRPGYVLTVEPGIYFIPALIDKWRRERKFADALAYDKIERFRTFGGIRIEDDVLVTPAGRRVLGRPIPKDPDDIEEAVGA